ncbi:GPP34 family phosphoprotein [Amycolatopsis sp. 195334CR]|uniref:GOLPH3/VPS74 family protein n=1 Tax=Amycolatopsis sp. 195334CR TaxID=2814588 RepID=UPI001A8E3BCB|nr:GPP34 family phosphoprotein [Amycolatopsis sp. 195334CR]MBN6037858.1 GPP34 family phosphoprotein [Amycolatopsis sp. 195334CR]
MTDTAEYSLPAKAYLLAWRDGRVPDRQRVGYLVRAAALTDLLLRGRLADHDGQAGAVPGGSTGDPVLDEVLGQIVESGPRKWRHWVRKDHRRALESVEEQLSDAHLIKVERSRFFGRRRITLRNPAPATGLHHTVDKALRGDAPVSRIPREDAALVALVAAVDLKGVVPGRDRRRHKDRLRQLEERGGAAVPVLRKVFRELSQVRAAAASGGAG